MNKLINVTEKAFGLMVPKKDNQNISINDLQNNEYLVIEYKSYWIIYGVLNINELYNVLESNVCTEEPTMQSSIRKMINNMYSRHTTKFKVSNQITACFLSNIFSQLGIIYSVYGNIVHTANEDRLLKYLSGEIDIPNLTQIITAYGGTFSFSRTMSEELYNYIDENKYISQSHTVIIPKPDKHTLLVGLSVYLAMTGCKFIEDTSSFYTNDDINKCMGFIDNLVIYDKIELQKN